MSSNTLAGDLATMQVNITGGYQIGSERTGIILAGGPAIPADTTPGYAGGCLYQVTSGGDGLSLFVNEGTFESCDFNLVTVAAA